MLEFESRRAEASGSYGRRFAVEVASAFVRASGAAETTLVRLIVAILLPIADGIQRNALPEDGKGVSSI